MQFWILVIGSWIVAALGVFLFMVAAFVGGAYANSPGGREHIRFFDAALLLLPGSSALAVIAAWVAYALDGGAVHYAWFATPLVAVAIYFAGIAAMDKQARAVETPKTEDESA